MAGVAGQGIRCEVAIGVVASVILPVGRLLHTSARSRVTLDPREGWALDHPAVGGANR